MKFKPHSLKAVVRELKKLPYVEAIILFGSHARGTARQDSDIDIAVITKGATEEQEFALLKKEENGLDMSVFSCLPLVIQFRIVKEGKILFVRNKRTLHAIRMNTIRDYLDFAPRLHNMYWRIINNV